MRELLRLPGANVFGRILIQRRWSLLTSQISLFHSMLRCYSLGDADREGFPLGV